MIDSILTKLLSQEEQAAFPDDFEAEWRQLDPVFIMGMQRSGTSILSRALLQLGIAGFGEGHLWLDIVGPLKSIMDPAYRPDIRDDGFTLGQGRTVAFVRAIAVAIDRFHRAQLEPEPSRWLDKSPGAYAVQSAPFLAFMFPKAQFIFIHRSGIGVVHSGRMRWPRPETFQVMCRGWAETMSSWRDVRAQLGDRALVIAHSRLASNPRETAQALCAFLGAPGRAPDIGELFAAQRVQTSFPHRAPGDYDYVIDWAPEEEAYFTETCGSEMAAWNYPLSFHTGKRGK